MSRPTAIGAGRRLLADAATALVVRALVVAAPMAAIVATWQAAGTSIGALGALIMFAVMASALLPDSHLGLAVVLAIGIEWVATVDDPTTPWSLVTASALAVYHAALAAASVAPVGARWTPGMRRRWLRRTGVVLVVPLAVWGVTVLADRRPAGGSSVLLAAALLVVVGLAIWFRRRSAADR